MVSVYTVITSVTVEMYKNTLIETYHRYLIQVQPT